MLIRDIILDIFKDGKIHSRDSVIREVKLYKQDLKGTAGISSAFYRLLNKGVLVSVGSGLYKLNTSGVVISKPAVCISGFLDTNVDSLKVTNKKMISYMSKNSNTILDSIVSGDAIKIDEYRKLKIISDLLSWCEGYVTDNATVDGLVNIANRLKECK